MRKKTLAIVLISIVAIFLLMTLVLNKPDKAPVKPAAPQQRIPIVHMV